VTETPPAGRYWQVVATARPDAEIINEALTKKGFHSLIAPGGTAEIFRVLVGPLKDSAAEENIRENLEAAGFRRPIMRRW
jgi:cell division septation protein DedD